MFGFLSKLLSPSRRQVVEPNTSAHGSPLIEHRNPSSQRGVYLKYNWRPLCGLVSFILAPVAAVGLIIWAAVVIPPPWITNKPINATAITTIMAPETLTIAGLTTPTTVVVTTPPVPHEFFVQTLAARRVSETPPAPATGTTNSSTPTAAGTNLSPWPFQIMLLALFAVLLLG